MSQNKIRTVKKVIKGLKKASKSHAKQARALQGVVKNGNKKIKKYSK